MTEVVNPVCMCGHKFHTHEDFEGHCYVEGCNCKVFVEGTE